MVKRGLGRGLDALLPTMQNKPEAGDIQEIAIEKLDPNKAQPRQYFDKESLEELAQSIASKGVLSPILVVQNKTRYKIIAGERRWRAARLAKLKTVPCIIKDFNEEEILQIALIENIQREDLNPLEEAEAMQHLMQSYGYTQEQLSQIVGKSRSSVANSLRLNDLGALAKKALIEKTLSFGHAKVLVGVKDIALQNNLCTQCILKQWTVRELELALAQKPKPEPQRKKVDAELVAFEQSLKQKLGLKAYLQGNHNKGKIILSYHSKEELNHLYAIIENLQ
ncbi:MAG: ParB/RepB/Spo0J family partition protein [Eubacteriales bacterium]|nr:ParB/RepB/Spo0J family partition protein [Eubacteriales bacterium]